MINIKDKVKGLKYELTIKVPYEEFEKKADEKMNQYAKTAKIQGFRTGHVPVSIIKQKYGSAFNSDTLNDLINDTIFGYVKEKNLKLAEQPKVDIEKFESGEDIKFSSKFEVFPNINNINLEKISITKKVLTPTDSDVDDALKELAESRHESVKLDAKRPTQTGDIAVIDFEGFIDGTPFDGGKGSKYSLQLGSKSFIEGFEDQLIGKNIDDEVNVNVVFPKDYHVKDLANKPAIFKVKIIDIRTRKIPEINDGLAVAVGRKDLSELKENIKKMQSEHWNNLSKNGMKNQIFEQLAKIKVELPESLINQEIKYIEQTEKVDTNDNKKLKLLKEEAEKRVKLSLILNHIGTEANVQVTDDDLKNAIKEEINNYPNHAQQVIDYYTKNSSAATMLKARIYESKVVDHILMKVKITEKKVNKREDLE